jgi:glycerate kinase
METKGVRVLACFDKFKDSLDADGVAQAVLTELRAIADERKDPPIVEHVLSLSDGGEGFLAALRKPLKLSTQTLEVVGLLALYGIGYFQSLLTQPSRSPWNTGNC